MQSVSGKNECMCSSSQGLCYGHMRLCAIHNSFTLYGDVSPGDVMVGISFVLVVLTRLDVSEPKQ